MQSYVQAQYDTIVSMLHIFALFNLTKCDELSTYIQAICVTSFFFLFSFFVKGMLLEIWHNFVMIFPFFFEVILTLARLSS